MEAGRVSQKRRFPKAMLLENSQVNLQHGRCKLTKRRCCVEPPPFVARILPVRLSGNGLLSSVRPCTLFPDIHPCMSRKDKFCAQNLLLINFPPILGRSDDKFF